MRALLLLPLNLLVLLAAAAALAGDPVVAKTLLESGKKAVGARKFDDGIALLRKALQEDPALAEAAYWIATAREKSKDDAGALDAYREFLGILDRKGAAAASAEEKKLRPLAEKRVEALAAGEREFRKLEDRYVEELMAFAMARIEKDPAAAALALDRVLAVRPAYPAAVSLYERMGKRPGGKPEAGQSADGPPFHEVARWMDFIGERRFISKSSITYVDKLMTIDVSAGSKSTPADPVDPGKSFLYDVEFRVVKAHKDDWLAGLTFAEKDGDFLSVFLQSSSLVLMEGTKAGSRDLGRALLPAVEIDSWHRLVLAVRRDGIQAWVDGKRVMTHTFPGRTDLAGELGIFHQACRVENRVFRAGEW